MPTIRQIASSTLMGLYGAFSGSILGVMATFWMWGLGFIVTLPLGFSVGVLLGWITPLRDATILFTGCFGSMAALLWTSRAYGGKPDIMTLWTVLIVILSGLLHWQARTRLTLTTRYRFALGLIIYFVLNTAMMIGISL